MGWGLRVLLPAFPDGACRRHDTAADPRRDAKIVPMVRPHPVLFDLAAGRPPRTVAPDAADHLLESAIDHRMTGLLWSAISGGGIDLPSEHERRVAARDAAVELHHRRLWDVMDAIHARLHALGIGVAFFKGVVAEARWYDRLAERPCRDLDLLLEPQARTRIGEVLEALQPAHPFREQLPPLVRSGVLQSIDLIVDGLAVDVHLDLLKFEVPTRQAERIWSRVTKVATPEGRSVPTIDDEVSLIHFLLHANKDRFSRLIAYADVARVLRRGEGDLDWPFIDDFLRREGLRVPVYSALGAITDGLGLQPATARPAGWRDPMERREEREVLPSGQAPIEGSLVARHQAHATADARGLAHDVVTGHPRASGRGDEGGGEHPDEGRLSGPVLAKQPEQLAAPDAQRDAVHRGPGRTTPRVGDQVAIPVQPAEALGEPVDLDRGLGRGHWYSLAPRRRATARRKRPTITRATYGPFVSG